MNIYKRITTFNLTIDMITFKEKLNTLFDDYNKLITSKNVPLEDGNGILTRYKYPILTAAHTLSSGVMIWILNPTPYLMERIGMNATLNSGAIKWNGKYLLVVRVEGADRKSFLRWPRVLMALTISVFGIILLRCRRCDSGYQYL